jgi:hypothetical protein
MGGGMRHTFLVVQGSGLKCDPLYGQYFTPDIIITRGKCDSSDAPGHVCVGLCILGDTSLLVYLYYVIRF